METYQEASEGQVFPPMNTSPHEVTMFNRYVYLLLSKFSFGKMRKKYAEKEKLIRRLLAYKASGLSDEARERLTTALKTHYFETVLNACYSETSWIRKNGVEFFGSEMLRLDFEDHLYRRLNNFRTTVVPWLDSMIPLKNASVLEIGCGTGSTTVALGEKGAKITAIDVCAESMQVAKERCRIYGINNVEFQLLNADRMKSSLTDPFDYVIFTASMEHMTHNERIRSIQAAYELVKENGHVVLLETPNRLWFADVHTSGDPFFHWLSDECAMDYAQFTPRESFHFAFEDRADDSLTKLARWGRGVSFHEFVIALGGMEKVKVASSMWSFLDRRDYKSFLRKAAHSFFGILGKGGQNRRYRHFLKQVAPNGIHEGFYAEWLYIALKK